MSTPGVRVASDGRVDHDEVGGEGVAADHEVVRVDGARKTSFMAPSFCRASSVKTTGASGSGASTDSW